MKHTQSKIALVLKVKQPTISKYMNRKLELSFEQGLLLKKKLKWSDNDIKSFIQHNDYTSIEDNTTSPQTEHLEIIKEVS